MARGWGFKIDYDKAIAEDQRLIAMYERAIAGNWVAPDDIHLPELVLRRPDVADGLDLTEDDVLELAYYMEEEPEDYEPSPGTYKRGKAIYDELMRLYPDWLDASIDVYKKELRRAKAALSRHRRNKAKYG